jgi:hypothetical protein
MKKRTVGTTGIAWSSLLHEEQQPKNPPPLQVAGAFKNQPIQQYQQTIASYMGKLLRDHFGKRPESVAVSVSECYIVN